MRHVLALTLEKIRTVWPTTLRSRFGWAFLASVIVVMSVVWFSPASAVGETAGNWLIDQLARIMLAVANLSIGLCIFFLRFFIAIASYNNYIDVDVVQLGWVMVRDVANMFFVVALLVIAFGTILGLEEYEWKKNLVKLVLAAIFINFSNLIAQLFIDVAHIFTMTFLNAISATAGGNLINMFKLNEITSMVGVDPDLNTEFDVEILIGTAVAATFAVLAAFAMGSYVFVMMARVVALWALIILSPLAYILGVLPKTQSYAERWWSEFSNYVIVAPVMVFFLWLSFATLGTGTIMSSIQEDIPVGNRLNGSKSVELQGTNFVESNDPSKISLSKVSTWENMANFLIALAFLRVGVKTTEETGVWGSDMVSDAWSFGKNVATIATGYAAGRWLAGKGQDTLKAGASKVAWGVPLVGGRALTTYGDRAKLKWEQLNERRDSYAKKMQENKDKLREAKALHSRGIISDNDLENIKAESGNFVSRNLGNIWGSIVESGGRADKRANDWSRAVEEQKKIVEENYSTSKSAGGLVKLELGVRAHQAEEMASEKKKEKFLKMEANLADIAHNGPKTFADRMFAEREKAIFGAREKQQKSQTKLDSINAGEKAKVEQITFEQNEIRERDLAAARDKSLVDSGRFSEAVNLQNILEKQAKARVERQGSTDYPVSVQRTLDLRAKIAAEQDADKKKMMTRSFSEMAISNLSRHYGFAEGNKGNVLGALGVDQSSSMELDAAGANVEKMQKQLFSYLLNENVQDLAAAQKRFVEVHGKDGADAMLEQVRRGLEKSASEGSVGMAGLLIRDVEKGITRLVDAKNADDLNHIKSRRTNAYASAKITSISGGGFAGAVDRDAKGNAKLSTDTATEILAKMITPLTGNNLGSIDEYTKGDLASVFRISTDSQLLKLREKLKGMDARGRKGLVAYVKERLDDTDKSRLQSVLDAFEKDDTP